MLLPISNNRNVISSSKHVDAVFTADTRPFDTLKVPDYWTYRSIERPDYRNPTVLKSYIINYVHSVNFISVSQPFS